MHGQTLERLADTRQQLENARPEAERPFEKEDELVSKTARLFEPFARIDEVHYIFCG